MSGKLYGLLAEFATADALLEAAKHAHEAGYTRAEAYAPFPVEGLAEAVGFRRNHVPLITFIGGVVGGVGAYFLQWYSAVVDYPVNIGGRPLHSWPSFMPITFELTILGAAFAALFGMFYLNGLPTLRHPLFDVPDFDLASRNRFFLCLPTQDVAFDLQRGRALLEDLKPLLIREVRQ
jgi:hypothetical protein